MNWSRESYVWMEWRHILLFLPQPMSLVYLERIWEYNVLVCHFLCCCGSQLRGNQRVVFFQNGLFLVHKMKTKRCWNQVESMLHLSGELEVGWVVFEEPSRRWIQVLWKICKIIPHPDSHLDLHDNKESLQVHREANECVYLRSKAY